MSINVGPNVTSFNDTGLKRNTKYYYRVLAFNNGIFTFPWSPILNVTTPR